MLGHANARTTLDTYGHVFQEDFAEPLAEMAAQLLPDVAYFDESRNVVEAMLL